MSKLDHPQKGRSLRDRDWDLGRSGSGRAHGSSLASLRGLRRGDRVGAYRRIPAAHGVDARGGRRRSHRDDYGGTGALGFRQFECAARGDRIHRRTGGGEIGSRPTHQPFYGGSLRRILARSRLQHRADRCGHRAGLPSNTARGGVLFPIVLSVVRGAGSKPEDPEGRRLGGYLMFCGMASLAVSSALWMTATSANPIGVQIVQKAGFEINFGNWLVASSVPSLIAIGLLPLIVAKIFPPRVGKTPEAPAAARKELAAMGSLSRDEWLTAGTFVLMVAGWVFGHKLDLNNTSVAFMGFGVLLLAGVITPADIAKQGDTLATFLWLSVLFAMSAQLNELGFMGYVGERLASGLGGLSWPTLYVTLIVLYVGLHYLFVSQTSQVLALFGVFLDVGTRGGVPVALMSFGLLFASSYFSVITPQGGSQNIIFAASGYLTQRELYKLGLLITLAFLAVYLVIGSPWVYLVMR